MVFMKGWLDDGVRQKQLKHLILTAGPRLQSNGLSKKSFLAINRSFLFGTIKDAFLQTCFDYLYKNKLNLWIK